MVRNRKDMEDYSCVSIYDDNASLSTIVLPFQPSSSSPSPSQVGYAHSMIPPPNESEDSNAFVISIPRNDEVHRDAMDDRLVLPQTLVPILPPPTAPMPFVAADDEVRQKEKEHEIDIAQIGTAIISTVTAVCTMSILGPELAAIVGIAVAYQTIYPGIVRDVSLAAGDAAIVVTNDVQRLNAQYNIMKQVKSNAVEVANGTAKKLQKVAKIASQKMKKKIQKSSNEASRNLGKFAKDMARKMKRKLKDLSPFQPKSSELKVVKSD